MYNGKMVKLLAVALISALGLSACGKEEKDGTEGNPADEITSGLVSGTQSGGEENNAPAGAGTDVSGENSQKQAPEVSWKMLRDARTDASGKEIAFAEYPEFSVSEKGFEALASALTSLNGSLKEQSGLFLDAMAENPALPDSGTFGQTVSVSVSRCDSEAVSIFILKTLEEGGPHPNNYSEAYNFNAQTGEPLELSDVAETGGDFQLKLKEQLRENYPELEFDDALLEQGIADALEQNSVVWYFRDGGIGIDFPVGAFGFGAAEGSLGVLFLME